MAASICRLMFRKETIRMEMKKHPLVDGPLKYLRYERQVRDGPVAAEHGRVEGRLFEDWRHLSDAEVLRELALQ